MKTVKYIVRFYYRSARCSYQGFKDHRKVTMRAQQNKFSKWTLKGKEEKGLCLFQLLGVECELRPHPCFS